MTVRDFRVPRNKVAGQKPDDAAWLVIEVDSIERSGVAPYDWLVQPDGLSLELTRVLAGPRERVFEFFTDAELLSQWWGPASFNIPNIEFAPSVGATYRIEMQPPEGDTFELVGTFTEVEPPSLLAFSFEWRPPDPDDIETVARLSFEQIDDSTEVRLTQQPFKNEARRVLHRDGWSESFDKLAELMTDER